MTDTSALPRCIACERPIARFSPTCLSCGARNPMYDAGEPLPSAQFVCTMCYQVGEPRSRVWPTWIGIMLLFFFLVPGLLYFAFRGAFGGNACALCGSSAIIPAESPRAQRILAGNG